MFSREIALQKDKLGISLLSIRSCNGSTSPRYDHERASWNRQGRRRINQEKLARFNQYNSMIVSKAYQRICHRPKYPQLENQIKFSKEGSQNSLKNTKDSIQSNNFHRNNTAEIQNQTVQKYMQALKDNYQQLNMQNKKLNAYLKRINVPHQLQAIIEQVQLINRKLKPLNIGFKALYTPNGHQQADEGLVQGQQRNIGETIESDSSRRLFQLFDTCENRQLYIQQRKKVNFKQSDLRTNQKLQSIQYLEDKFNNIIAKIESRQQQAQELSQLDKIERQLDQIRQLSKSQTTPLIKLNRNFNSNNQQKDTEHKNMMTKVKSHEGIFI